MYTNKIKLKAIMDSHNVTLEHLADVLGMSRSTLYAKLNQRSRFYVDEVYKICRYLRITNSDMIEIFFTQKRA